MHMKKLLGFIGLFGALPVWAQSIVWLSSPGMDTNYAIVVSGDGNLVGGRYWEGTRDAPFVWTPESGMVSLARPAFPVSEGTVLYVDPEGRFALGYADSSDGNYYAFRWTRDSGTIVIPELPPNSVAYASNGDSMMVGESPYSSTSAYAWRMINGVITDTVFFSGFYNVSTSLSGNGLVVGVNVFNDTVDLDYRWVPDSGSLTPLAELGGGYNVVSDVSYDGSVLVGCSADTSNNFRAVLWHADGSVMDLGTLGGSWAYANSVSDSGDMVVGSSALPTYNGKMKLKPKTGRFYRPFFELPVGFSSAAFVWTPDSGMRDMNEMYSSVLGSSVLLEAWGISPNGRFIVGIGYNSATGLFQGFVLDRFGTAVEERGKKERYDLRVEGRRIEVNGDARIYDTAGRLVGEVRGGGAWVGKAGVYLVKWRGGSRITVLH